MNKYVDQIEVQLKEIGGLVETYAEKAKSDKQIGKSDLKQIKDLYDKEIKLYEELMRKQII